MKNPPAVFSRVVVAAFNDFIQKFMQVYMDDWIVYRFIKDHLENLRLMLERCRQHQIALISKKCIFCAPFGILLGHIICNQGIFIDLVNIALILSLSPPTNMKMLRATLGHTGYCRKFIRGYAEITTQWRNY